MGLRFRLRQTGEEKPPLWLGLVDAIAELLGGGRFHASDLTGSDQVPAWIPSGNGTSPPRFLDVAANTADREHAEQNVSNALTALRTAETRK